jgi:hypothetical protein
VLNRVAIAYAQDEFTDDYIDVRVCQHLSPACRAAHSHIASNLATASILRHIDDADVAVCRLKYEINLAAIATAVFTIPLIISLVSAAAGDVVLESLLPAFLDAALIMNYYFYTSAGLFILMPYLVAIGVYLWKHKVHKASRKMLLARRRGESSADYARCWNAANRARQVKKFSTILYEQALFAGYYVTRPMMLSRRLNVFFFGHEGDPVSDRMWGDMNRHADLQGKVSSVPLPDPDYSYAARVAETRADEEMRKVITQRIPMEVHGILCAARHNWLQEWTKKEENKKTPEQIGLETRNSRYLIARMTYDLTHVHLAAQATASRTVAPLPDVPLPPRLKSPRQKHSRKVLEYHDRNRILHNADEAVEHMLRGYKKNVAAGKMSLVDSEDRQRLQDSTIETCNVLIEFFDLRALLEEALRVYRPLGQALTFEERQEVVESCYSWLLLHSDEFLSEHYNANQAKVSHALLVRKSSSLALPDAKPDPQEQDINYSVPFQKFRRWFNGTAAAVERYRETQAQEQQRALTTPHLRFGWKETAAMRELMDQDD